MCDIPNIPLLQSGGATQPESLNPFSGIQVSSPATQNTRPGSQMPGQAGDGRHPALADLLASTPFIFGPYMKPAEEHVQRVSQQPTHHQQIFERQQYQSLRPNTVILGLPRSLKIISDMGSLSVRIGAISHFPW